MAKITIILGVTTIVVSLLGWQLIPWLQSRVSSERTYLLIRRIIPDSGGTIVSSPLPDGDGKYSQGSHNKVEAKPAYVYRFIYWSGDASGTMTSEVVTMDNDKNIIAELELIESTR